MPSREMCAVSVTSAASLSLLSSIAFPCEQITVVAECFLCIPVVECRRGLTFGCIDDSYVLASEFLLRGMCLQVSFVLAPVSSMLK